MSVETHDVRKEVKKYYIVFAALLILTIVTVAASNNELNLSAKLVGLRFHMCRFPPRYCHARISSNITKSPPILKAFSQD